MPAASSIENPSSGHAPAAYAARFDHETIQEPARLDFLDRLSSRIRHDFVQNFSRPEDLAERGDQESFGKRSGGRNSLGTLRQPRANFGDVFMRGWPVRIAGITVEHQCAGFQLGFEFFLTECNRLVVIVRTNNFKIHAVAHEPDGSASAVRFGKY